MCSLGYIPQSEAFLFCAVPCFGLNINGLERLSETYPENQQGHRCWMEESRHRLSGLLEQTRLQFAAVPERRTGKWESYGLDGPWKILLGAVLQGRGQSEESSLFQSWIWNTASFFLRTDG